METGKATKQKANVHSYRKSSENFGKVTNFPKVSPCGYRMKGCTLGAMKENSLYRVTPPHITHLLSLLSGGFLLIKWIVTFFSAGDFLTDSLCSKLLFCEVPSIFFFPKTF